MMFRSIVIQGSMVGFWNAMPTRNARAATSRPPTITTPVDGCTSPLTSRRMVDLPHPEARRGKRRHRAVAAAESDRGLGQFDGDGGGRSRNRHAGELGMELHAHH